MMRAARGWLVLFVAACLFGFAGPAAAQSKSPQPRVYLLRGLANVFSLGMDDLTAKLNARGIKATVHPYTEWQTLARYAAEQSAAGGGKQRAPVIIIGHSLGADAAVYMANRVTELGAPVPLVVTFDPVTPTTASSRIGKVVNYYQAGGSGKPVSGARVSNVDLTRSEALTHLNIDKSPSLHEQVIAMIVKGTPRPAVARKPKPKPVSDTAASAATPAVTTATGSVTAPAATAAAPAEAAQSTPAAATAAPAADAKPAAPM
jgi:pimeloyl-ACP methyl ester carboxylesterase